MSAHAVGAMIGNSMDVILVARILARVLRAIGRSVDDPVGPGSEPAADAAEL
jgi:hypothetical protein